VLTVAAVHRSVRILGLAVVFVVAGIGPAPAATPRPAAAVLAGLAVKGRAPMTGYSRAQFGPAWADANRNGCDTRNDVLNRDLTAKAWQPGTRSCVVIAGKLVDPYTARTIVFAKATAGAVQIDHVVALGDAWQKGAQQLSAARRQQFANDPLNLLAVDGPTNAKKGAGDAATWLPPNKAVRCAYVARQVTVKAAYGLWVTSAERAAIASVLASCPGQPTTAGTALPPVGTPATTTSQPQTKAQDCTAGYSPCIPPGDDVDCAGGSGNGPRYVTGPVHVDPGGGDPYDLDRDGDGTGCE
jgi:hypothetical protein